MAGAQSSNRGQTPYHHYSEVLNFLECLKRQELGKLLTVTKVKF